MEPVRQSRPAEFEAPPEQFPVMERRRLVGFERFAVPLIEAVNRGRVLKSLSHLFVRTIGQAWITFCTRNLLLVRGLEKVRDLDPPRGVLLVSNHRSFFDMFITSALLFRTTRFMGALYFPVRKNYFYERFMGVVINLVIAGGAMWPPVFRDERKTSLNPRGLDQLAWVLRRKGAVVGYHPEGTRGKGPDPYSFLPAKPGLGHLVQRADAETLIVPYFILGLSNDIVDQVGRNFRRPGARGEPIRVIFGDPIPVGDLDRSRSAKQLSEDLLGVIGELANLEREQDLVNALPDRDAERAG